MNLKTIAKMAHVSVSTVSKAFSDSKDISDKTREDILNIAKRLGVYDKYYKGKYNRKIIAVIAPEIKSQFYCAIIAEFNDIFYENNCTMVVSVTNFNERVQKELIRYYATFGHSDGIIVMGPMPKNIDFNIEVPIVVAMGLSKNFDSVYYDSTESMNQAIAHLKENGHINIGFIGEKHTSSKLKLFKQEMYRNRIDVNDQFIITSDKRFEDAGYHTMNKLFESKTLPTAIVAAYDYIALGIYRSICEHGFSVPKDFSIIGMDDIDVIKNIIPPITSIGVPPKELCLAVCDLIFKKIENKFYTLNQNIPIKTRLVKRESVYNIKK